MWFLSLCFALVLVSNKARCQSFPNGPQIKPINGQILELLTSGGTGQIPQNIPHSGPLSGISRRNNGNQRQGNKINYSIEKNPRTGKLDLVITERSLIPAENKNQRTPGLRQFFHSENLPQSTQRSEAVVGVAEASNSGTPDLLLNIIDPATGKVIGTLINQNNIENRGTNTGHSVGIGGNKSNIETHSQPNFNNKGNATIANDIATQETIIGQADIGLPSAGGVRTNRGDSMTIRMDQLHTDKINTEKNTKANDRTNNMSPTIKWSIFGDSTGTTSPDRTMDHVKSPVRFISPGSPSFSDYSALSQLGSTVLETASKLSNIKNVGSDPVYLSDWQNFHSSMPTSQVNVGVGANAFSSQKNVFQNAHNLNFKGIDINGGTKITNVKIISPSQHAKNFNLLKSLPRLDQILDLAGNSKLDAEAIFKAKFANQNPPSFFHSQRKRGRNRSQENMWNRISLSTPATLLDNSPGKYSILKKSIDVLKNPVLQEVLKKFSLKPTKIVFLPRGQLSAGVQSSNLARRRESVAATGNRSLKSGRETPTRNENPSEFRKQLRYPDGRKPNTTRKGGY